MALDTDIMKAVDELVRTRVADLMGRDATTGTVISIIDDNTANVTFDGATNPIPVKLNGAALIYPNDRVVVQLFGKWWVALAPLTRRWPAWASTLVDQTTGTTVSGAASDVPNSCQVSFTKHYDSSAVEVSVTAGAFSTGVNTQATWGAYFFSATQPIIPTYSVCKLLFNTASEHLSIRNSRKITDLIADDYVVSVRWSRTSGSGTISCDGFDQTSISVREISP